MGGLFFTMFPCFVYPSYSNGNGNNRNRNRNNIQHGLAPFRLDFLILPSEVRPETAHKRLACSYHIQGFLNGQIKCKKPANTMFAGFSLPPRPGFEPGTLRLTAGCSTAELSRNMIYIINYNTKIIFNSILSTYLTTEHKEGAHSLLVKKLLWPNR